MKKKTTITLTATLVILTLFVLIITALVFLFNGKIKNGTYIAGINLSNLTEKEAIERIKEKKTKFEKQGIEIQFNGIKTFSPEELGIKIFEKETVNSLEKINTKNFFVSINEILFNPKEEEQIQLITEIDEDKTIKVLGEEFGIKDIKPVNSEFYLTETGELEIGEAVKGYDIDKKKLFENIYESAGRLNSEPINLELIEKEPEIVKDALEERKEEIRSKISHRIKIEDPIYSDPWYVSLKENPKWARFESNENETKIYVIQEEVNKFIDEEISKWLDLEPENVNIYTQEDGKIIIEGRGNDGKKIQRERLKEAIEMAVKNKVETIVVPVKKVEPKITISEDLQEKGIKERIGIGHTSYYGSPANRVHNIKVGSEKFQGKIIAPGEVFSFNQNLGKVDGTTGYRKELVIKPDGTKPEWGGGICQVSTTMYRAVLFTGLPIVKRYPHSYAVSYYSQTLGHGLDATIYLGGPDLQFENDTDNHLLIQTYTQNDYELYFVFYGTSDNKKIEMEGPYLSGYHRPGPTQYIETTTLAPGQTKQVEKNHTGFTAIWYRYITDGNGKTTKETLTTRYKAIPARILVGVER